MGSKHIIDQEYCDETIDNDKRNCASEYITNQKMMTVIIMRIAVRESGTIRLMMTLS